MAKHPELHSYSDRTAQTRLMLLISAIANNPGIAPSVGPDPMVVLLQEMQTIAKRIGGEDCIEWSPATIRKDLAYLRSFEILPEGRLVRGYYLGQKQEIPKPVSRSPQLRKSKLTVKEIKGLRIEGLTMQEIGDLAGVSRSRIEQIVNS